ncbi:MAG: methyltransferase domain-containing protein [Gammaproteobacteria bacterium]|nr:methyltransferase domain-containing protein [Gammaproteobacteria bacterium]
MNDSISAHYLGTSGEQYVKARRQDRLDALSDVLQSRFFEPFLNPSDDVLDFGCGNGSIARCLQRHVRSIVGLEVNDAARGLGQQTGLEVYASLASIPAATRFDAIVTNHCSNTFPTCSAHCVAALAADTHRPTHRDAADRGLPGSPQPPVARWRYRSPSVHLDTAAARQPVERGRIPAHRAFRDHARAKSQARLSWRWPADELRVSVAGHGQAKTTGTRRCDSRRGGARTMLNVRPALAFTALLLAIHRAQCRGTVRCARDRTAHGTGRAVWRRLSARSEVARPRGHRKLHPLPHLDQSRLPAHLCGSQPRHARRHRLLRVVQTQPSPEIPGNDADARRAGTGFPALNAQGQAHLPLARRTAVAFRRGCHRRDQHGGPHQRRR